MCFAFFFLLFGVFFAFFFLFGVCFAFSPFFLHAHVLYIYNNDVTPYLLRVLNHTADVLEG